jgi:hypothetical protein
MPTAHPRLLVRSRPFALCLALSACGTVETVDPSASPDLLVVNAGKLNATVAGEASIPPDMCSGDVATGVGAGKPACDAYCRKDCDGLGPFSNVGATINDSLGALDMWTGALSKTGPYAKVAMCLSGIAGSGVSMGGTGWPPDLGDDPAGFIGGWTQHLCDVATAIHGCLGLAPIPMPPNVALALKTADSVCTAGSYLGTAIECWAYGPACRTEIANGQPIPPQPNICQQIQQAGGFSRQPYSRELIASFCCGQIAGWDNPSCAYPPNIGALPLNTGNAVNLCTSYYDTVCGPASVPPPCQKKTCAEAGATPGSCGMYDDGCGGQMLCDSCNAGQVCVDADGWETPEGKSCCTRQTCNGGAAEGATCGVQVSDGCGGTVISCNCAEGLECYYPDNDPAAANYQGTCRRKIDNGTVPIGGECHDSYDCKDPLTTCVDVGGHKECRGDRYGDCTKDADCAPGLTCHFLASPTPTDGPGDGGTPPSKGYCR